MTTKVHLGFSIPSGEAVEIPLKHMVITGQTQEAGKTTALEALIARTNGQALTFVTKRGEGSFRDANQIAPFLKTRGDWQYVASILEASRNEKLKFERPWIIRVSKGATTLREVHSNVRRALVDPKVRGLSLDVYTVLDAYLEVVVPQIDRIKWAPGVILQDGVNVMDLTLMSLEMQHLVIASSIEQVQEQEHDTLVVIPEAWKFLPQGRNTPSKLAAVSFIRQAAAMHNYLWLDSQDLGGIEKEVLRSVAVWLLGVQRETNEIKRTLENIPAGVSKPNASFLAGLDLGQFYACWKQTVSKIYVQPKWLSAQLAQQVAMGIATVDSVQKWAPKKKQETAPMAYDQATAKLMADERRVRAERDKLLADNESLVRRIEKMQETIDLLDSLLGPRATPSEAVALKREEQKTYKIEVDHVVNEIKVTHTIETIRQNTKDLGGRVAYLLAKGSLDASTKAFTLAADMKRRGWDHDYRNVDKVLKRLTEQGFLTVDGADYRAVPGMKVHIKEAVQ